VLELVCEPLVWLVVWLGEVWLEEG